MKGKIQPRFSIVIPCYNEDNYISAALESLLLQTTKEKYEVIIVDNNCTDKTVEKARKYGVRVVSEETVGVCWARQAGAKAANGEIIISTDADTTFSPEWLSTIDKKFRQNEKIVAVTGPCRYYDGPWWGKIYPYILFGTVHMHSLITGRPYYITATNIAFKKSAWDGYDTSLTQGGDELYLLHKFRKVGKVHFLFSNPVHTSGRRLTRGLTYNFFVSFLYYYLAAYHVNKRFGRTIIGAAPTFRADATTKRFELLSSSMITCYVVGLIVAGITITSFRQDIINISYNVSNAAEDMISDVV